MTEVTSLRSLKLMKKSNDILRQKFNIEIILLIVITASIITPVIFYSHRAKIEDFHGWVYPLCFATAFFTAFIFIYSLHHILIKRLLEIGVRKLVVEIPAALLILFYIGFSCIYVLKPNLIYECVPALKAPLSHQLIISTYAIYLCFLILLGAFHTTKKPNSKRLYFENKQDEKNTRSSIND